MKILKLITVLTFLFCSTIITAKDYNASMFGIKSNGTTLNTNYIQKGIDFISANGGGRLVFYVGRYLTGTIYLKSNVTIHLEEGAILVGSVNPLDYEQNFNWTALIFALDQENIGITGKGVIDGQGFTVANNLVDLIHKGVINDPLKYDRPRETIRPQNIYFRGCRNIMIRGIILKDPGSWNQQYDQCRNLVVDGIIVDSLRSINTGNVIFLRIGERREGRKGKMENISISNVYAEVPATKPDAGYNYEGPVEDLPRNISPSSIVGMPDAMIENVTLKNIEICYPGGGNPNYAKVGLDELEKVPELAANYPEFSMFKELPAWGFYIRHVKGITFENVTLTGIKEDYRTAVVLDDVHGAEIKGLKVNEPDDKKKTLFSYKSTGIIIK